MQAENPGLHRVVLDMLHPASLPSGWSACFSKADGCRIYTQAASGHTSHQHPRIAYYRGVLYMERGGMAQMMEHMQSEPPAPQEIQEMEEFLGIRPGDDRLVREVAAFECCAPLPPSYVELERSNGDALFRCAVVLAPASRPHGNVLDQWQHVIARCLCFAT